MRTRGKYYLNIVDYYSQKQMFVETRSLYSNHECSISYIYSQSLFHTRDIISANVIKRKGFTTHLPIQHNSTWLTFCANTFRPWRVFSATWCNFTINIFNRNIFSPKEIKKRINKIWKCSNLSYYLEDGSNFRVGLISRMSINNWFYVRFNSRNIFHAKTKIGILTRI